jgi:hypothetical protein
MGVETDFKPAKNSLDPLLGTIKFNPFNLRNLKEKLPKASYEN